MKKECIAGDRIRFTVNIPNEHLKSWCELKEDGGLYSQFSYVEILNASIVENGVKIRQDCTRINGLIRRSCGEVKKQMPPATRPYQSSVSAAAEKHCFSTERIN